MWQQQVVLQNNQARVLIDSYGAWLRELSFAGKNLLYPARQTGTKTDGQPVIRGGSHVCVPNFGPDASGALPQHGYGRLVSWEVVLKTPDTVVLRAPLGSGAYSMLESELHYELHDDSLVCTLHCRNNGTEALAVSPGFHPYFASAKGVTEIGIGQYKFDARSLGEAMICESNEGDIAIGNNRFRLQQENLSAWVVWSDAPDAYVCVEPTSAGFAFRDGRGVIMLAPGESKQWSMIIR